VRNHMDGVRSPRHGRAAVHRSGTGQRRRRARRGAAARAAFGLWRGVRRGSPPRTALAWIHALTKRPPRPLARHWSEYPLPAAGHPSLHTSPISKQQPCSWVHGRTRDGIGRKSAAVGLPYLFQSQCSASERTMPWRWRGGDLWPT
jgi:hypothetical protein